MEKEFSFYVVNNRRHEKDGDQLIQHYNLTLPEAVTVYNGYDLAKTSAIGVNRDNLEIDLVHRLEGESILVTDYQQMEAWNHNPYVCIWAVSELMFRLDIHRQKATLPEAGPVQPDAEPLRSNQGFDRDTADARSLTRPFEERLHVMRMKDTEELRRCFLKGRDAMARLGVEPTMDLYDLIYTEPVKPGESMVDVCKRYQLNLPTPYMGFAPTVSDVLVYQTRRGCHALIIDSLGFESVDTFIHPPD